MRVTVISIVAESLGTPRTDMEKRLGELELRGRIETSRTTALLKSA